MASSQQQEEKIIVVTGCTGNQGLSVIKALQSLAPEYKFQIRGICRRTETEVAQHLKQQGVQLISADLNDAKAVTEALKSAWAVFGVTDSFTKEVLQNPELEYLQGVHLVDACVINHVSYFVWSTLENCNDISGGKFPVPHFTNKARVSEYALSRGKQLNPILLNTCAFNDNLFQMIKINQTPQSTQQAVLFAGLKPETKTLWFDVHQIGDVVAGVLKAPEKYSGKTILVAKDCVTMPDICNLVSKVLDIPVTYIHVLYEELAKRVCGNSKKVYNPFGSKFEIMMANDSLKDALQLMEETF